MIGWNWSGPESKKESSKGYYQLARVVVNIFVGMWGLLLIVQLISLFQTKALLLALGTIALFQAIFGTMIWGLRHLTLKFVVYARLGEDGLQLEHGQRRWVQPWHTIGDIRTVPFVQPALWRMQFTDGSPAVAFFTTGSSWNFFGLIRAKSVFVEEIRRRAAEAMPTA